MLRQQFQSEEDADGAMRIPGYMISLEPPREPAESAFNDFIQLLTRAMTHAQAAGEALIVEFGGWDPPTGSYCLFVEAEQHGVRMKSFQTAPPPEGSE